MYRYGPWIRDAKEEGTAATAQARATPARAAAATAAGVEAGNKSIAISIVLREKNKTLEENEINSVITKILEKVKKEFGAELRQ